MREITVDLSGVEHRKEVHALLAAALSFPDYYGKNLDALHDCLTDITEDTALTVSGLTACEPALGHYTVSLRRVLTDAAEDNAHLTVTIE